MLSTLVLLAACTGGDRPEPPPPDANPSPGERPMEAETPGPEAPPAQPTPATPETTPQEDEDPAPPGCGLYFSEDDANGAFAALAAVEAGCSFEGVTVRHSSMTLRWKPTPETEVSFVALPAACGEGETVGALVLQVPAAAAEACPKALAGVRALASAGKLPTGAQGQGAPE